MTRKDRKKILRTTSECTEIHLAFLGEMCDDGEKVRGMRQGLQRFDPATRDVIEKFCQGNGIDIGCGWQKIGGCVGIDLAPFGQVVDVRAKPQRISQADWSFDADNLPLKDNTLDFIFASHVLEHITLNETTEKTAKALGEWVRVVKSGGFIVMIIPDINHCIAPVARKKGLRIFHGLQPADVLALVKKLPVEVTMFKKFLDKKVFTVVLKKV